MLNKNYFGEILSISLRGCLVRNMGIVVDDVDSGNLLDIDNRVVVAISAIDCSSLSAKNRFQLNFQSYLLTNY